MGRKWEDFKCKCGNENFNECREGMRKVPTGWKSVTDEGLTEDVKQKTYNGHTHTGDWHYSIGVCDWVKCQWRYEKKSTGLQHWSCCCNPNVHSVCENSNGFVEHAPIYKFNVESKK